MSNWTAHLRRKMEGKKRLLLLATLQLVVILAVISDQSPVVVQPISGNSLVSRFSLPVVRWRSCPVVLISKTSLPLTALASYPGSGNTWMRHLLQEMTGVATGSVYNDILLRETGFPGEGITNGSVIAVKTHYRYEEEKFDEKHLPYKRVLLLMRDPYHAMLAEFQRRGNYNKTMKHVGRHSIDKFITNWNSFCKLEKEKFANFYLTWLEHPDVHIIYYDELKRNLQNELQLLALFLQEVNITSDVSCAVENPEGNFHRKPSPIPTSFFYSQEKMDDINQMIIDLWGQFHERFDRTGPMLRWIKTTNLSSWGEAE